MLETEDTYQDGGHRGLGIGVLVIRGLGWMDGWDVLALCCGAAERRRSRRIEENGGGFGGRIVVVRRWLDGIL